MPANLTWRSQAREDSLLIYEFIGLDNPAAAERLFAFIEDQTTLLIHHPRIGPRRPAYPARYAPIAQRAKRGNFFAGAGE
jgi:plasmid stabilization system protein ParE